MGLSRRYRAHLKKLGCFAIGTIEQWPSDRDKQELAACKRFVAPLIASATHARLYPSPSFKAELGRKTPLGRAERFLIPRKGFFELDLTRECVRGYEDFWRANRNTRGSIVVVQPGRISLRKWLDGCVLYGPMATRYQLLKFHSAAGLRFAETHPRVDERIFLFSQTNGVEHVDLFPPHGREEAEFLVAERVADKPSWES